LLSFLVQWRIGRYKTGKYKKKLLSIKDRQQRLFYCESRRCFAFCGEKFYYLGEKNNEIFKEE